jgi:hypothetical protein
MSEKKYKYTVKRFAKMLTVHPDRRVTFQDDIDLRNFIGPQNGIEGVNFNSLTDLVTGVTVDDAHVWTTERNDYWPGLVEHGALLAIANEQFEPPPVKLVGVGGRFIVGVEFELNPDKVAAWLAATGFPQISRAKEAPNANPDVAG